MRNKWLYGWILMLMTSGLSAAAPVPIPDALRDWVPWALHGFAAETCPTLAGDKDAHVCLWPGELRLDVGADGATFSLPVTVHARSAVPLPGDSVHWPQDVTSDGQALAVVANEQGRPVVWFSPGRYRIEGRFSWDDRPESIAVPSAIARIALRLDGIAQPFVQRDDQMLWLGRTAATVAERDDLTVAVYRLLEDRIPALLETRIKVTVSGKGREAILPTVLPEGFEPVSLSGDLHARLDGDANLILQVRSGEHWIRLVARATAPLASVQTRAPNPPWPETEIWSYRAQPSLRVTEPVGPAQIDPALAEVPAEWRDLPAFSLAAGEVLSIAERSRGLSDQDQNRLHLNRTLWLDHDGGGFTARDRISGQMIRGWRLDLAPPFKAMRATENGEPVLITEGATPGHTGVELRTRDLDLIATARIDQRITVLPATGWQHAFESVQTTLNVPPGYELIAVTGADRVAEAWLDRWNLMDVFVAALIVLLYAIAFGKPAGLVPAVFVLLAWHEPDVPQWSLLLSILAAILLAPTWRERLPRWAQRLAKVVLLVPLLAAVPFLATQLRLGLYPQLEAEYGRTAHTGTAWQEPIIAGANAPVQERAAPAVEAEPPVAQEATFPQAPAPKHRSRAKEYEYEAELAVQSKSESVQALRPLKRYASNTMIQAGGGEPSWNWRRYSIELAGPVLPTQEVRLWLSPPWLTRLARFAIAGLFVWIALRLIGVVVGWPIRLRVPGLAGSLVLGLLVAGSAPAQSLPDSELIEELRERLLKAPECSPNCGSIPSAEVTAIGDSIDVDMVVHAAARVGLPLPGNAQLLAIDRLDMDGQAVNALHRDGNGAVWIEVPRGVHRIALRFATAAADQIALVFPMPPAQVHFRGQDWEAVGIEAGRLPNGTLELRRIVASDTPGTAVSQRFDPYAVVTRELRFDLDWEVATTVRRIAPESGAFSIGVPVLEGERVTSEGFELVDGVVQLRFGEDDETLTWMSRLDPVETLQLRAPELARHAEVWTVVASPTWNVRTEGVPSVHPDSATTLQEFHPLPGETLRIAVSRPEAVAGRIAAIDRVELTSNFGKRAGEHTLAFELRATQGGQHALTLPKGADVLRVVVRGETLNLRPENGILRIPVRPGANPVEVGMRIHSPLGLHLRLPDIDLGTHASNLELRMQLPSDRWVLMTRGPGIGPAVLYWSEVIVMLVLAFAIARSGYLPIRLHEAFLLGIGFSTVSWWSLLFFVAVLAAFAARARWPSARRSVLFNLSQIALAVAALLAVLVLVAALNEGLLGYPDLHVTGHGSTATRLQWFADQTPGPIPDASALVLPLWVYRGLMLAWAFWLAWFFVRIGRFVFESWTAGGAWANRTAPGMASPSAEPPPLDPPPAKSPQ